MFNSPICKHYGKRVEEMTKQEIDEHTGGKISQFEYKAAKFLSLLRVTRRSE